MGTQCTSSLISGTLYGAPWRRTGQVNASGLMIVQPWTLLSSTPPIRFSTEHGCAKRA